MILTGIILKKITCYSISVNDETATNGNHKKMVGSWRGQRQSIFNEDSISDLWEIKIHGRFELQRWQKVSKSDDDCNLMCFGILSSWAKNPGSKRHQKSLHGHEREPSWTLFVEVGSTLLTAIGLDNCWSWSRPLCYCHVASFDIHYLLATDYTWSHAWIHVWHCLAIRECRRMFANCIFA